MEIISKAQKSNLSFLDKLDVYRSDEDVCNSCYMPISEILEKTPHEFLLNCKKNDGKDGCTWVSCNRCLDSWIKAYLKKHKSYKSVPSIPCPQCKRINTFDVDYKKYYVEPRYNGYRYIKTVPKSPKNSKNPDYILNPLTGRYVKKTGSVGKKILKKQEKKTEKTENPTNSLNKETESKLEYNQSKTKVKNPKTKRWVNVTGKIGKKLIKETQETHLDIFEELFGDS